MEWLVFFLALTALIGLIGLRLRIPEKLWFFLLFCIWPPGNKEDTKIIMPLLKVRISNLERHLNEVMRENVGGDTGPTIVALKTSRMIRRRLGIANALGFLTKISEKQ